MIFQRFSYQILKVIFITSSILLTSFSAFSQLPANTVYFGGSFSYYPTTWQSKTRGFSIGYERKIASSFRIGAAFNYTWGDLEKELHEYGNINQTIFYNDVILKDLKIADLFLKYAALKNQKENLFFIVGGGPSFIWGHETILESVWYGLPFHESTLNGFQRHEMGLNICEELIYYPIRNLGVGGFTKFRIYSKHEADLTFGINVAILFADP